MQQLFKTRLSKKSSGVRWFAKSLDSEGHWDIQLIMPDYKTGTFTSPFRGFLFDEGITELERRGHSVLFHPSGSCSADVLLANGYREVIV